MYGDAYETHAGSKIKRDRLKILPKRRCPPTRAHTQHSMPWELKSLHCTSLNFCYFCAYSWHVTIIPCPSLNYIWPTFHMTPTHHLTKLSANHSTHTQRRGLVCIYQISRRRTKKIVCKIFCCQAAGWAVRSSIPGGGGVKWPGSNATHSLPYNAEVMNEWIYSSTPPTHFYGADRDNITFHFRFPPRY